MPEYPKWSGGIWEIKLYWKLIKLTKNRVLFNFVLPSSNLMMQQSKAKYFKVIHLQVYLSDG